MTELLHIHPGNPQARLIEQAVRYFRDGKLIVYPTDSCYALGCHMGDHRALKEIRRIRQTDRNHNFTLVCRDLSEIASYARVENWSYRYLKSLTPGPYTFVLRATRDVPRRMQNPRKHTIGIRLPEHPIAQALLEALDEPIISSTLILPGDELPMTDPDDILHRLSGQVDIVVDGGSCGFEPTTVIDMTGDQPEVLRQGKGELPHET
ncbi:MAG: L-threonylcarbamoyladenylate synthase [Gammaproteobacteria bacterium]